MAKDKAPKAHTLSIIETYTERLHTLLGVTEQPDFNIISAVENNLAQELPGFFVEVLERRELSVDAHTEFNPPRLLMREEVYYGAYRDDPRSRFTVAHELGHLCLHWGYPMPRLPPLSPKFARTPTNNRIEAEANLFASAFLMPRAVALKFSRPSRLANICRVSELAATIRLSNLLLPMDDLTTTNVLSLFGKDKGTDQF